MSCSWKQRSQTLRTLLFDGIRTQLAEPLTDELSKLLFSQPKSCHVGFHANDLSKFLNLFKNRGNSARIYSGLIRVAKSPNIISQH